MSAKEQGAAPSRFQFKLPSTNVEQGPITQTPPPAMTKPPKSLIALVAVYAIALVIMVVAIAVFKSPG